MDGSQQSTSQPFTLKTVLAWLTFSNYTFSLHELLRYGITTTLILTMALYTFSSQIVLILLLMVLLMFVVVYIAITRTKDSLNLNRPIDPEKLRRVRDVYSTRRAD